MIYFSIPLAIWGLTLFLLRSAKGQRGFDLFFSHFTVIASVGLGSFIFYQFSSFAFKIYVFGVGLHSLALLLYALWAVIRKRSADFKTVA